MTNNDLLASIYVLLDNISEKELDIAVAKEQLGSVLNIMQYEKTFGNLDDVINKEELVFSDTTGLKTNSLTNFGHPIYLEFNNDPIEESPVGMLDMYYHAGIQRVSFWTDEAGAKYIQLSIPQTGTLKVWYEPDVAQGIADSGTVAFRDSLRWCIATRTAQACLMYVKYLDPAKQANKPALSVGLQRQADHWEKIYLELVNRIGTNRPFSRLPFMAGISGD